METKMNTFDKTNTASLLQKDLSARYGEVIGGDTLRLVLGFSSKSAMNAAISRKTLTLPTFFITGRRGRQALTSDVATWLVDCRASAGEPSNIATTKSFKRKISE